ncbi:TIGR04222 domain-containing membrane protein [Streptomyces sp. KM273126]|uniref:TIGR04222 domain-containing membrane protein n=1 Tax=Streptomyces sp. KM273126 TaxID=2545247 RepID=UPI00103DD1EC|nr:TIGR04222 domain-containing membrane protein [Streptomyces sp. KM273126]MBA2809718.1 TIGR04222 domain-containing membrane protein [Streptomyces sp. KM273126]
MVWPLLLLLAWVAVGTACMRLCLAAARSGAEPRVVRRDLTLYEAAFLFGGPARVAELTLVAMARQRRLLLAHTGWATVVDPDGRDDMERSVIGAIGPEGQSRIAPIWQSAAAAESVRRLADRLVAAGLAVPDGTRTTVAEAVRQVRGSALLVTALGTVALLMPAHDSAVDPVLVALWFALPLILSLSCLAIARVEVHPYSRWASPAGQRLLAALTRHTEGDDDRTYLTSVAVRGVRVAGEPEVRAAFGHR